MKLKGSPSSGFKSLPVSPMGSPRTSIALGNNVLQTVPEQMRQEIETINNVVFNEDDDQQLSNSYTYNHKDGNKFHGYSSNEESKHQDIDYVRAKRSYTIKDYIRMSQMSSSKY